MTTQTSEDQKYEVIIWDYDAAPDAAEYFSEGYTDQQLAESILPYYCSRRYFTNDLYDAKYIAREAVIDKCSVGAAVFLKGETLAQYGSTFSYRKHYF